jgi:hypothetical protein
MVPTLHVTAIRKCSRIIIAFMMRLHQLKGNTLLCGKHGASFLKGQLAFHICAQQINKL